ncbi:MAG: nitrile hydratase subunit alpha [Acidimicrobiia bacterium]
MTLTPEHRTEILERHLAEHGHLQPSATDDEPPPPESSDEVHASLALGSLIVARAWTDPDYRARLLADATATISELVPQHIPLRVLEDTPELHHVVVCTLCSCYPSGVLGPPPSWYKSFEYRSRVVREPRAVLAEFGMEVPGGVELQVVDSTSEQRYLVLPLRPDGTEGWSVERLAGLVTRDALIGTAWVAGP